MKKFPKWQKVGGITIVSIVALIGILYLLRVPIFGPMIENAAQNRLESSLGSGGDYSIGKVEGSYIRELKIQNVNLQPPPDSSLREVKADEIIVTYNLLDFFGSNPVSAVKKISARGLLIRVNPAKQAGTLGAGTAAQQPAGTNPGALIAGLTTQLPEDLTINADGRLIVNAPDGQYAFPFNISGNTGKEVRINAGTPEGLIPWTLPVLLLTTGNGSFKLSSEKPRNAASGAEVPVIELSADTEKSAQGEVKLSSAAGGFRTNDIQINLNADQKNINVLANLSSAGTAKLKTLLKKLTGGLSDLSLGTMNVDLKLNATSNAPDGFLDYLLKNPIPAQAYLSGGGSFSAKGWLYKGIPIDNTTGTLQWKDKLIEIDNFRLVSDGIFTVTAGSLLVDPQQKFLPINLDQLNFEVHNALKFLNLLRSGNAPFLEQLSGGGTSLLDEPGRPGDFAGTVSDFAVPVSYKPRYGLSYLNDSRHFKDASPLIVPVQAQSAQPPSAGSGSPQLPFQNLPLNITTGNISFKQGKLIIGTFSAPAGSAFELSAKNLAIVPGNTFLPTGLDSLGMHLRDPEALKKLLEQTGGAPQALSLLKSADLTATGRNGRIEIGTFDVKTGKAALTADGSFQFASESPVLHFNLTKIDIRHDSGGITGAASGSVDLKDFAGNAALYAARRIVYGRRDNISGQALSADTYHME